jgi:hypothetical protein
MAEVFVSFDIVLRGPDELRYGAQACGRERADGLWEGWVEFPRLDGGAAVHSGRETTQPNRDDLLYWATGLTAAYLDGALLRTLQPALRDAARDAATLLPAFDAPAGRVPAPAVAGRPRAVIDPFAVYAEGDDILRGQLGALSAGRLRHIVRAYALSTQAPHELDRLSKPDLITLILQAMQRAETADPRRAETAVPRRAGGG